MLVDQQRALPIFVVTPLPLAADFSQAVGAHFELVAEPLENFGRGFRKVVGLNCARDQISTFSLGTIVNEVVLSTRAL